MLDKAGKPITANGAEASAKENQKIF